MSIASLLPLTFVMIAGPQIVTALFFATSEHWRVNSAAYLLGAAVGISAVVAAAYLLGVELGGGDDGGDDGIYIVVIVLLLAAMIHAYLKRAESKPPKWMGRLQTASPRFAFTLGFGLLGFFPTDILTSVAVAGYLAGRGDPLTHAIPFLLLTLLLLALPVLLLLIFRERGERMLPKIREWMTTNAWIVNEVVLAFFVVIVAGNL